VSVLDVEACFLNLSYAITRFVKTVPTDIFFLQGQEHAEFQEENIKLQVSI